VGAIGNTVNTSFGDIELLREHASGSVQVMIRPEQFEIVNADSSGARVTGDVVATRYFGHDGTVDVRFADGTMATVRLHARLLPDVGSTVGVVVHGRVLAFDA
jgi:copper homeostasis protein CutC